MIFKDFTDRRISIAVVGLGYVGLPLAIGLGRSFSVLGFDISPVRIEELKKGHDRTEEVLPQALHESPVTYTANPADLEEAGIVIVAVPTPIDSHRNPDLSPMIRATETVGEHMRKGCIVVYESTVYPGVTEEICVPLLERVSGLEYKKDFMVGYSPERINPGDKVHTLETIKKIVSGTDQPTTELLAEVYGSVVKAGIHKASSIKVAEAAKVIENTQRDLNIALMNELAIIFEKMNIDTLEVLEAAGTKWNFLPFSPGLVGGHCIGVDPYYLTYKAQELGYNPQVILAGRRINDSMGKHVAEAAIKKMIRLGCRISGAKVGILGLTFKENVPDLRNTRVIDVVHELQDYGVQVLIHDPCADPVEALEEYGIRLCELAEFQQIDALILAVPHQAYVPLSFDQMRDFFAEKPLLLDVKGQRSPQDAQAAGFEYWRL